MAKSRSLLRLHGTIGGLTFVESRAYGKHVRLKRGTHKPAVVNDSFKENSLHLIGANAPARMVKAALDPYCKTFQYGQFWQRLVSVFRVQLKERGKVDLSGLEGMEVNAEYPLDRFLQIKTEVVVDVAHATLHVKVSYDEQPRFKKSRQIDGYRFSVIAIFPDANMATSTTAMVMSPLMELNSKVEEQHFQLALPPQANEYLVCVKIEGTEQGYVTPGSMAIKGMKFVSWGKISPSLPRAGARPEDLN